MAVPRLGRDDLLHPPPGNWLVRHSPHRVSTHSYHLVTVPALQNTAREP
jgi:hypothetical protein